MDKLPRIPSSTFAADLTDADILEAMKALHGYLDITPADFKEIYTKAYQQAREGLSQKVKARHIMTREVVQVEPETSLKDVAELMSVKGVSGVPVVDNQGQVLGMISEKDFLRSMAGKNPIPIINMMGLVARCLQSKQETAMNLLNQSAGAIMSSPVITIQLESTLGEITRLFSDHQINRAPVIDLQGRLVGMVSRGDVIRAGWGGNSSC